MPRLRSAFIIALVLSAPFARAAAQDDTPSVYIVSVAMDEEADAIATRAGAAARAALRTIEGVSWRVPDQAFLGYDESALTLIERARQRTLEGRTLYEAFELDRAIPALEGAVADFDAAAAALEDPGDLGSALLYLGASYAFSGQRRQASAIFRRLHTQMPHVEPDPNTFNPDVLELFEQARPPDARNPSGVIAIDSNPPGAIAYVDFLARGRTPITVDNLPAGDHVVRVSRPGATPFVETLEVRRGRTASSNAYLVDREDLATLNDALGSLRDADVGRIGDGSPIGEIASMLGVSHIGVIRVSTEGGDQAALELLVFDVESGRRIVQQRGTVPTQIGRLEEGVLRLVAAALEAALHPNQHGDDEEAVPVRARTPHGPTIAHQPTIFEEAWFWGVVGGAVLVVGAAIVIGVVVGTAGPGLGSDRGGQVIFTF